jgi:pimeloyl-ACP methyl ester carboxylesterase
MKLMILFLTCIVSCVINAQQVNDSVFVNSSDAKLYLEVVGKDKTKPLLLHLHGGPGNVVLGVLPFQVNAGKQLEEDFLVAYLHQRGAGKSSPVPAETQTIENHVNDVAVVVEYLKKKYGKDKVHLSGHSWGGMLAASYLKEHEQNVNKLILISTGLNVKKLFYESYLSTLDWAEKTENETALKELNEIKASLYSNQNQLVLSKWSNQAGGGIIKNFNVKQFLKENNVESIYSNWGRSQFEIRNAMYEEFVKIDLDENIGSFRVPVLFIAGGRDTITPVSIMKRDFELYRGDKEFAVLESSHHLPFIDEPKSLAKKMIAFLEK